MTADLTHLDTKLLQLYGLAARFCAGLAAVVALAVCVGWLFDIGKLEIIGGGAALCFFACGASLLLLISRLKTKPRAIAGYAFAGIALVVAALNVGRFFFGLELLTWLPETTSGPDFTMLIGIPGQNDAIELVIFALALFVIDINPRKWMRPADVLGLVSAFIAYMSLLGVIFGVEDFCLAISCLRISTEAALLFALLSIGLLFARPDVGVVNLLARQDAGGMSARFLVPVAFATPLLLGWIRLESERAHLFGKDMGFSIMFVVMLFVYLATLWWHSTSLGRLDIARREALKNLEQNEKRTRMILQQAIDAFVAVDAKGTIKDWNARAESTFGFLRVEAVGQTISDIVVPPEYAKSVLIEIQQMLALQQQETTMVPSKPIEAVAMHKLGYEFPVEISLFPVVIEDERILCAFARDISERKELENRFKDFYSTVSHELRSPLTSIRGCLTLIKEVTSAEANEAVAEMVKIADNSLERLMRLINDLLDVKRIEEGKLTLDIRQLDPINVITTAADGMKGMAHEASVELLTVVDAADNFMGDADRVVQVLTNMVSNAIKFSPADSTVTLRVQKNEERMRFSVSDQGPGIPPEQLHRLFSKFGQLTDKSVRQKVGTGLGLAISKAIVEEHGGEVGVDSMPGKGTTFWFELPIISNASVGTTQMQKLSYGR